MHTAENLNGRLAMVGIAGTTLYELLAGHPLIQLGAHAVGAISP